MPTTRKASNGSTITTASNQQQTVFEFPESHHLIITTPRHVFAWDSSGVHTIFQSRRGSIVAAREAKDGSGVLAVASSKVIVMHDTTRGKEESWGLNAPQDEVRHIEYTPDAKSLFLSTTTDGTIQHYSTERRRLVDSAQKHETSPAALAISPTGHMILSASQNPPVVYLKNLAHNTAPLHVQPSASISPVCFAAFHPERQNVFLLAFKDGTIAAYDATRTAKKTTHLAQASTNDGEIARIVNVHRAVASGDNALDIAAPVAGAAFLPGYKTRAVTAGRDGKCKIVDFANGGVVIRTWHARAPITSISVLALKPAGHHHRPEPGSRRTVRPSTHTIGGPTSTDSIITVSRVDGKVQIYDSVGLLLVERSISGIEEKILSIEWAKGPSPAQTCEKSRRHFSDDETVVIDTKSSQRPPSDDDVSLPAVEQSTTVAAPSQHLGLPTSLKKATLCRQLAVLPEEEEFSTVRYTPSPKRSQPIATAATEYQDLFSPVKQSPPKVKSAAKRRISSPPPRNRPRLSSQTFVRSPETRQLAGSRALTQCKPALHPEVESHATSSTLSSQPIEYTTLKPPRGITATISPLAKSKKHITFAKTADGSISSRSRNASVNQNARVLADLRKLARTDSSQRKHGTLSSYAVSQRLRPSVSTQTNAFMTKTEHFYDDPAESTSSRSFTDASDDIWLTSDSDEDRSTRRRRRKPPTRPPGRQTSRSRMDSSGTMSTAVSRPISSSAIVTHVDGSTEDDAFSTARSQLSPAATFDPPSEQVRALFPRSSSLSPSKKRNKRRSRIGKENMLTHVTVNDTFVKQPRSPWARVKACKGGQSAHVYEDTDGAVMTGALSRSGGFTCPTCPETKARVQGLENEVAQLKGEVIALKAVLRRNGLPLPAFLTSR